MMAIVRDKRIRGLIYMSVALALGGLVESHQPRSMSIASLLGASGIILIFLAIVGELGFWVWTKISN